MFQHLSWHLLLSNLFPPTHPFILSRSFAFRSFGLRASTSSPGRIASWWTPALMSRSVCRGTTLRRCSSGNASWPFGRQLSEGGRGWGWSGGVKVFLGLWLKQVKARDTFYQFAWFDQVKINKEALGFWSSYVGSPRNFSIQRTVPACPLQRACTIQGPAKSGSQISRFDFTPLVSPCYFT